MNIHYIGEHLLPGFIGKAFVWTAFAAAIITIVLYILDLRRKGEGRSLVPFARAVFLLHALSLLGVAAILYYLIFNHYFEYTYVWQYSSTTLPLKYIISCFWAGQEGSFLIWAVFQAMVGVILLYRSGSWERRVMPVMALSQVFMTSMMLGIELLSLKIGGSPFTLLRETYTDIQGSIFEHPEYVQLIGDGNGLNPLLENIWMTIHPPILFLGYALALVPFAFAVAGLTSKNYSSWIRPALPWTLISLFFLGGGILLGGAWAYVSLTFGGFWAWDPVENSSLVPWMTLIAGLHFMLIARKQRNSLFPAVLFIFLSYLLILYASFLTRSGVLADTSAHSFGDNGMTVQLLVFILTFLGLSIYVLILSGKHLSGKQKDVMGSREFWIFIGSVVMVVAAFQIIFTTSIPVFNQLFGTSIAPPSDPVEFYNRWQLPFVLLIAIFIGVTQFLNYFENDMRSAVKKMLVPAGMAAVLMIPFIMFSIVTGVSYLLLIYVLLFAIFSSVYNLIFRTAKPVNYPAIITHIGFLIFIMGTVLTFSNSKTISMNVSGYDLGDRKSNAENLLMVKGDTLRMTNFHVVYSGQTQKGNETIYQVDFLTRKVGRYVHEFTLFPTVNRHPRMGDVYNPDTKHFLWVDYYTYISAVGQAGENQPDYIVIKTIMNPFISILWTGAFLMIGGIFYAFAKRMRRRKISNT